MASIERALYNINITLNASIQYLMKCKYEETTDNLSPPPHPTPKKEEEEEAE